MAEPLRYIIVGTGGFGGHWCRNVLPRLIELGKAVPAAAVDINPEALKTAREQLKLPAENCYTDMAAAFDDNRADFAIVVVPPAHHEEVVDAALSRGMHVLSEKPIADTMEASCRVYRKVRGAGRKMAVTMSHRFDRDKQTLLRLIRSGEHGGLDYLVGRNTWMCRKRGSWGAAYRHDIPDALLVEGTVHQFDIMRALAGANAGTVYARTWNAPWGEFKGDSQGLVTVVMENGVSVFYEGAKCNASELNTYARDYWRAECEGATLELDNRKIRVITGALSRDARIRELPLDDRPVWTNAWLAELFCDWLAGGEAPPNTIEDNIQCAALTFAAVESAHTGRVVDVQEYLKKHLGEG